MPSLGREDLDLTHEYCHGERSGGHEGHHQVTESQFRCFLSLSFLLVSWVHIDLRQARA